MARNVAQADASAKAGEKAFRRFTVSFQRSKTIAALFGDSIDCFDSSSKSKPQPTLCDELILPAGYPCSEYMMRKYISVLYYSKSRDPSAQWFSFREEASRLFPYSLIKYSTSLLPSFSLSLLFSSLGRCQPCMACVNFDDNLLSSCLSCWKGSGLPVRAQ
ncbi:hypothetical protein S83_059550 [Arachis hypogaea]